jgi:hypothetical protein
MNLLGAVWSNNALSTLRVSPNPAYPSRNCLSPFGLGESVLKPLFSGSHWVSRTSACENCCCDFLYLCGPMCVSGTRLLEMRLPPATGTGDTPWSVQAGKCPASAVMTESTCLVSMVIADLGKPAHIPRERFMSFRADRYTSSPTAMEAVPLSTRDLLHRQGEKAWPKFLRLE